MVFGAARESELDEIVAIVNRAYRGTGDSAGWNSEAEFMDGDRMNVPALQEEIAAKPEALLLALREDESGPVLGSVWLEPKGGGTWYLGMLNVRAELQDRQIGRRLLEAAEEAAKERGAEKIRMTVIHVRETLIAWYERRGYRLTGETEPFPHENQRFGRPLRTDLHFVVLEKAI